MPIQKIITLYTFAELNDSAKEKARQRYIENCSYEDINIRQSDLIEDAKTVGLKIIEISEHRANKGEFIDGAFNCANKILAEHGGQCETHKTAKKFLAAFDALPQPEDDNCRVDDFDVIEADFLQEILEDYRILMRQEEDYCTSDEYVDEQIIANEYTYTEDGKRQD